MQTAEELFYQYEKLLYKQANNFHRKFGGDIDDLVSICYDVFVRALKHHDDKKTKLTTYLWTATWRTMYQKKERAQKGRQIEREVGNKRGKEIRREPLSFVKEISEDSQTVVKLIIDRPLGEGTNAGSGTAKILLRSVMEFLSSSLGWSGDRINNSLREIREALP